MSFDVFVQAFRDGDGADTDARVLRELIAPHIARQEDEHGFAELRFPDGTADLHGLDDLETGFLVNHISGEAAWDFLVDLARRTNLAILPIGCPTAVCREDLLTHLPAELRDDAVVVTSGAHLLEVVRTS